jgi:hypothetical protein
MSIKNIDVIDLVPVEAAAIATADEYFADIAGGGGGEGNVAAEMPVAGGDHDERAGSAGSRWSCCKCGG